MNNKQKKQLNKAIKSVTPLAKETGVTANGRKYVKEAVSDEETQKMLDEKLKVKDRLITNIAVGWKHAQWLEEDFKCLTDTVDHFPDEGYVTNADGIRLSKNWFVAKRAWSYFKLQETYTQLKKDMGEEEITIEQVNKRLQQLAGNVDQKVKEQAKS